MTRYIDVDELVSNLKKLENEYSYADGSEKYAFVYGVLTGVRQAITYAKAAPIVNNEWISVEDRLPEEDVRVLVYLDSDRSYTKIDTDRLMTGGLWVRWFKDVTHWMPLPEPPTEKEN